MGRVKGCLNKNCLTNKKKITYKEGDDYCSKCGEKLSYVCKKCYTQLPDKLEKYCVRCLAEKEDIKNKRLKIGGGVLAVGGTILGVGKTVIKAVIKK